MKKKSYIGIAMSLFAVATVFNMNMMNENGAGDVSLDVLTVMAQATGEGSGGSGCPSTPNTTCDTFADGSKGCFPVSEPGSYNCR